MWGLEIDKWISFPFVKSFQSQQSRGKAHLPSSSMVRSSSLAETRSSNSSWVGERPLVCSEYLQGGFCQHFQSSCFRIFDQHLQLIASVCIDIVYKPKQMRIIVLFLVLFADLEGHLPNNLNWTNIWPVSRNYVITINCLWTFSVFTCTLSFVLFLCSALSFENWFVCTFHVLNIFLGNQLPHLFHLLEEVGVVVLLRSLRTETSKDHDHNGRSQDHL